MFWVQNMWLCFKYVFVLKYAKYWSLTHLPQCRIHASVNWVSIGSGYDFSPIRRQTNPQTNTESLQIVPLGTIFSEIRFKIQNFSLMRMHLKCRLRNSGHLIQGDMGQNSTYLNYISYKGSNVTFETKHIITVNIHVDNQCISREFNYLA